MVMITGFNCPNCGVEGLRLDDELGRFANCLNCGHVVKIIGLLPDGPFAEIEQQEQRKQHDEDLEALNRTLVEADKVTVRPPLKWSVIKAGEFRAPVSEIEFYNVWCDSKGWHWECAFTAPGNDFGDNQSYGTSGIAKQKAEKHWQEWGKLPLAINPEPVQPKGGLTAAQVDELMIMIDNIWFTTNEGLIVKRNILDKITELRNQ